MYEELSRIKMQSDQMSFRSAGEGEILCFTVVSRELGPTWWGQERRGRGPLVMRELNAVWQLCSVGDVSGSMV